MNIKNKLLEILKRTPDLKSREQVFWEKQIKIEERLEKRFKKELIKIFEKQRKKVLDKLGKKIIKVNIPDVLLDVKEEGKIFVVALSPIIREIVEEEGNLAFGQVGIDDTIDMGDPIVVNFLDKNTIKFSNEVNKYTNKKIRKTLSDGIVAGEGIPKLAKRVNVIFDNCEKSRSVAIARTESSRAMNFATEETYRQSGVVEGKKWLTAYDERTCERCLAMDGKIVSLGDNYFDKGDTFMGLELDYEDTAHPPLHVLCRCSLTPVLIK